MNKKTLKAIAEEAKYFTARYQQDVSRGVKMSYSDWLLHTENSTRNNTTIARTEAVLGIYRAEDGEQAIDARPSAAVLGQEEVPDVFPKMGKLNLLNDEAEALEDEILSLKNKIKDANGELETIPEENEDEENPEAQKEEKKLSPDEKRLQEIEKRLADVNKKKAPLDKEFAEYTKKKTEYDEKIIKKNREKATEDKEEYQRDLESAEKSGLHSRIGLLSAAKDRLNRRTWRDYLFHPFRSIGENMRYSEMRESFLEEYGMKGEQLDAIVAAVGDGTKDLDRVKSINENGEIQNEEPKAPARDENEINVVIDPKETEQLQNDLDKTFAPEKSQKIDLKQPSVDEPQLEVPNIHQ